jgi:translation elongation factor EF-Tu-like GTPase
MKNIEQKSIFAAFEGQQIDNAASIKGGRKILDRGEAGDNVGLLLYSTDETEGEQAATTQEGDAA